MWRALASYISLHYPTSCTAEGQCVEGLFVLQMSCKSMCPIYLE